MIKTLLSAVGNHDPLGNDGIGGNKGAVFKEQSRILYHISSGAPQIQPAFRGFVSADRLKANVYQAVEPRFLGGNAARMRLVECNYMEDNNQIQRARHYFQRYNFDASASEAI